MFRNIGFINWKPINLWLWTVFSFGLILSQTVFVKHELHIRISNIGLIRNVENILMICQLTNAHTQTAEQGKESQNCRVWNLMSPRMINSRGTPGS